MCHNFNVCKVQQKEYYLELEECLGCVDERLWLDGFHLNTSFYPKFDLMRGLLTRRKDASFWSSVAPYRCITTLGYKNHKSCKIFPKFSPTLHFLQESDKFVQESQNLQICYDVEHFLQDSDVGNFSSPQSISTSQETAENGEHRSLRGNDTTQGCNVVSESFTTITPNNAHDANKVSDN